MRRWLRGAQPAVADLARDARFALRRLIRHPWFTVTAVLTLTLGIGANAAMFAVVRTVLLRPLPFPDAGSLVSITSLDLSTREQINLSPADFLDFERESPALSRLGAYGFIDAFTLSDGRGEPERVGTVRVTEGYFPTLGVQPALGRVFTRDEDQPSGERVAILSDGFWRRRFGGDRSIVGRVVTINALPATIIGVLPATFRHVEERTDRTAELFMLYGFDQAAPNRGGHFIRGVGRLPPGRTSADAQAGLTALASRLEREYPRDNTNRGASVTLLHEAVVGRARPALLLLLGVVGLVMLIVCANLGHLLLASGATRERELAVRAALGAGRSRLLRQLLTESVALALTGAAGGLALAMLAARSMAVALAAAGVPRAADLQVDWQVTAFTAGAAVAASVAFGLLPALALTKGAPADRLAGGGRHAGGRVRRGAREALILGEVAVALVLLVGAGLVLRTLWRLEDVNPGFAADRAVAMDVALPTARYPEGSQVPFYEQLEQRTRALPGVVEVGAVNILPLSNNYDSRGVQIEDAPQPVGRNPSVQARSVTRGYFAAMGVPLLRGRLFDDTDRNDSRLVIIVSESMAQRYWPDRDPIGRRVTFNSGIAAAGRQDVGGAGSREIVGVVGDVKHLALDKPAVPAFYTPHSQPPSYHAMTLVVRTAVEPAGLTRSLRAALDQMDREVPLSHPRTLEQIVATSIAGPRVRAVLLALFAGLALVLASVGVYGVVGCLVVQRTHEIGIRLALGASTRRVLGLLVRDGMRPVCLGIVLGLGWAIALSRLLSAMVYGVTLTDASVYASASVVLAVSGLIAALVPARRALGADPIRAIRS